MKTRICHELSGPLCFWEHEAANWIKFVTKLPQFIRQCWLELSFLSLEEIPR